MSFVVFIAIGCAPWIDMKGGNMLFGISVLGSLWSSLSGQTPVLWIPHLAPWLIGWLLAAVSLGWCLQCVLLVLFSWYEKWKRAA
jgi:hypothetical protein